MLRTLSTIISLCFSNFNPAIEYLLHLACVEFLRLSQHPKSLELLSSVSIIETIQLVSQANLASANPQNATSANPVPFGRAFKTTSLGIRDKSNCVAFKLLDASAAKSASRMWRRKIELLPGVSLMTMDIGGCEYAEILKFLVMPHSLHILLILDSLMQSEKFPLVQGAAVFATFCVCSRAPTNECFNNSAPIWWEARTKCFRCGGGLRFTKCWLLWNRICPTVFFSPGTMTEFVIWWRTFSVASAAFQLRDHVVSLHISWHLLHFYCPQSALHCEKTVPPFLTMTLRNALQMCFRLLVARHMEKLERHQQRLGSCVLCHCDVAWRVLESAWQCGLRFILSVWWSSRRAQCLAGLSQHRLSQAQSNRDRLPFRWCGGPRGCVLVVLRWFRWRRFSVVFLWCEKLLWSGGSVASCCCVCGGVSKTSVGEEWCREVLGKRVVEMRGGQSVGEKL